MLGARKRNLLRGAVLAPLAALALFAGGGASAADAAEEATGAAAAKGAGTHKVLRATVRRTKYGIPHIRARNVKSLAAGWAYAFAEDNICTIASEYVTVSGERSRYFGPDETWTFSGNNSTYDNIDADTYFKWTIAQGYVPDLLAQPPPEGPKRGIRRGVAGYVRGYNAYLKDTGVENISDPACRGEPWVRKIRKIDVYRRFFQLGILASSGAVISGITDAAPVSPGAASEADAKRDQMLETGEGLEALQPDLGSNAYGLGGEATKNGRGMVLGNPHFPWHGSERLYQSHLTIPGKVDVQGGSLYGFPLVNIGFTRGLAWSHTVATAWRFTPYKVTLAPDDPYSYIVDGETKPMEATEVTVQAKLPDETIEDRTRTIYSTEWGPMVNDLVGIPLPWTEGSGFALADVNVTNFRYLNHFLDNNRAQSVEQYDRIQRRYQGIPWVNSLAADSEGNAYYSMNGAIPNVPDELAAECNVLPGAFEVLGLPVLDGSRSACAWEEDPEAVSPGTFASDEIPSTTRSDYVANSNDSHWLTNPEDPLTGFDRIIGIEDAERYYRTRMGLMQIEERLAGTDGRPGTGFGLKDLEEITLGGRVLLGEMWRDPLVQLCDLAPGGFLVGSSGPVDVSGACDPLRDWDLRDNLESSGAILFRRFATRLLSNFRRLPTGLQGDTAPGAEVIYTTPYSNTDPVHTPSGLNIANPLVGKALADAVTDLQGAGIPLDAGLAGHQFSVRGGEEISVPGGPHSTGVFNVITPAGWDPAEGYRDIRHGSSFIMAAQFTGGDCPVRAGTFVTYSQSENQDSPHAGDYTRAFAEKRWHHPPFCAADVKRATQTFDRLRIRAGRRP
ncbi:MAG: penicillin acylase family protein [Solirubrobacterales bacterium]